MESHVVILLIDATQNEQGDLAEIDKMLQKIDFSLVKKSILLFSKSDIPGFNPLPVLTYLKTNGLVGQFDLVEQISIYDSDFDVKLINLINRLV